MICIKTKRRSWATSLPRAKKKRTCFLCIGCARLAKNQRTGEGGTDCHARVGGVPMIVHGRSRMTIDPRTPTRPGGQAKKETKTLRQ